MRMLNDNEIAQRMLGVISEHPEDTHSVAALLKQIPYDAEELLPVGDLTSVHNALMTLIAEKGIQIEYLPAPALLPARRQFKLMISD